MLSWVRQAEPIAKYFIDGWVWDKAIELKYPCPLLPTVMTLTLLPPHLHQLPASLPLEGAVRIDLQEGIPIFKASRAVQERVQALLDRMKNIGLSEEEELELDQYEEIDSYLSFVNRLIRNQMLMQSQQAS